MKKLITVLGVSILSFYANAIENINLSDGRCYGILEINNKYYGAEFECEDRIDNKNKPISHISEVISQQCYSFKDTNNKKNYEINQISCPQDFGNPKKKDAFLFQLESRLTNVNCKELNEWDDGCPVIDEFGNEIPIIGSPQ